ncbi:TonB-dependent receptor [Sphingomonas hengshuiensis]|uniref:TonB-dependent receptor n=1 Tax=Sphingomonas hengshuiensis TaxID=1609977 RepID=UPI000698F0AA|nr:TonB-dependent receptor [Sphingomonas hengshuiensis]
MASLVTNRSTVNDRTALRAARNSVAIRALIAATLSIAPFGIGAALAQDAPLAQDVPADEVVDTGDIVVTANRTVSLASKTPIALNAVSGADLTSAGVTNPTTLSEIIPTVTIDRTDGLRITIRGVSSNDNTEKGDPSAAFLLDGIYIARPQAQEVSFFDLDRVEVLRGPQGTLYGRNTTAGVVNVISALPKHRFEASIEGSYGNFDTRQLTGMINVPIGDHVAVRAAVNYDRRDSYIRRGDSPYDLSPFKDNLSGRLSVLADLGERTTVLVRGDYSAIKGRPTNAVSAYNFFAPFAGPVDGQRGTDPAYRPEVSSDDRRVLGFAEGSQSSRDNSSWGVMTEVNHELGDRLTLTYLGSYREFERDEQAPGLTGFVPGINLSLSNPGSLDASYWQTSHELRLAYSGDRLQVQVGGYFFKEHSVSEVLITGLLSPTPGTPGYVFGFLQDPTTARSIAGFGQATYSLTDRLRVTGGLRYTSDDKSRLGATIIHSTVGEPLVFPPDSLNDASRSFNKLTWKSGVEFDLNNRTLLYASISTGYKAGGFNDGCLAGDANCTAPIPADALFYKPETLTAYEVGFKTRMLDNALRLNGSYFHYDYNDLQLSQASNICGGPCQITTNAATAKIDGVELEAVVVPSPRNRFGATVAWLNARFTDYEMVPGVNFAGAKLDRSPEWVAAVDYSYSLPLDNGSDLTAQVRSRISDSYEFLSSTLRAQFHQPSYTRTDLNLTYNAPDRRWYLQGFVKNLEDTIVLSSATTVAAFPGLAGGTVTFQDPRTYGMRAGFKF